MHLNPAELFFVLLIGHAVADYPLQGDFLARAKNHNAPIPGINPIIALKMHAFIHAGAVWIITGSFGLALIESVLHTAIDWAKCDNRTSFTADQVLHVICKILYVALLWK